MIKECECGFFSGFYESMYSNSDMFIDEEAEDLNSLVDQVGSVFDCSNVTVEYDFEDYDKYKSMICSEYVEHYFECVDSELTRNVLDFEYDCTFEFKELSCVCSPKYYNYHKDRVFMSFECDEFTLNKIKEYSLVTCKDVATKYLKSRFTSCDGFSSYYPNNIKVWVGKDVLDYDYNELGTLFDIVLLASDDDDVGFNLNYSVHEDHYPSCYACVSVYDDCEVYGVYDFLLMVFNKIKSMYPVVAASFVVGDLSIH